MASTISGVTRIRNTSARNGYRPLAARRASATPANAAEHDGDQRAADWRPSSELRIACFSGSFSNRPWYHFVLKPPQTSKRVALVERVGDDEADRQEQEDVDEHRPRRRARRQEVDAAPLCVARPDVTAIDGHARRHPPACAMSIVDRRGPCACIARTIERDDRRDRDAARIMTISSTAIAEPSAQFCAAGTGWRPARPTMLPFGPAEHAGRDVVTRRAG